ncbi:diacylglycerol kinase family protein [Jeotgalibacillus sp. S-D1]|nr:diacylglycerol kinase family protein [Jeotgalibacillus sp. S-D1]
MRKLAASFRYAWEGVKDVWINEQNFKIHSFTAALMILLGFFFKLAIMEWIVLLMVIAIVLSLEVMNTAIERSVDLITASRHPLAKKAKDASAAAVFLFACGAAVIGMLIFLPKIIEIVFK